MNRFSKSTLANTLQIAAIVIMFGYPGCSSNKVSKEPLPSLSVPSVQDTVVRVKTNLIKTTISGISKPDFTDD